MIECLSFHASYGCRHSGACCSAGWNLPFTDEERARVEPLQLVRNAFVPGPDPGVSFAARRPDGACVFLDAAARLCTVHAAAGQQVLPLTCRMFPRVVRHDAAGTRLSLSHYCPTAASLLDDDAPTTSVVEAPASLIAVGELDGLDARDELPPLLRPGVLTDVASYRAWEDLGVDVLTSGAPARDALDEFASITRDVAEWKPGEGTLLDRVRSLRVSRPSLSAPRPSRLALQRWLAARLFGNWIAYQGHGLATIVAYLRHCLETFEREIALDGDAIEAFRRADYQIVHEADSQELARALDRRADRSSAT